MGPAAETVITATVASGRPLASCADARELKPPSLLRGFLIPALSRAESAFLGVDPRRAARLVVDMMIASPMVPGVQNRHG
jgi:hypothetical protein